MVVIREKCYPLIRLHKIYDVETSVVDIDSGIVILVESGEESYCIFADTLILSLIHIYHEYYDGSGYPFGLKGKQIPAFGRIIACADVYDALTASRPYRAPSPACDVIEYVMAGAGIQFDLDVVNAFLKCISPYPIGACVVLCDGRIATIYEQNSGYPLRPKIVLFDSPYKVIDLKTDREYLNVTINGLYDN